MNSQSMNKDKGYYLDFYSSEHDPRYVIFGDKDYLKPTDWIIVQVEGKINANAFGNNHAYMLAKTTVKCGKPLYAIYTGDEYYSFSIIIEDKEYTLTSTSKVGSDWQKVTGVYTGAEIQLYVEGVLEDSYTVSGKIVSSENSAALVFGYDTACDNYQYYGYMDNIYIYGE